MNVEATIRHNGSDGGNYVIPFARYIFSAKIIDEDTFNVISTDACADPVTACAGCGPLRAFRGTISPPPRPSFSLFGGRRWPNSWALHRSPIASRRAFCATSRSILSRPPTAGLPWRWVTQWTARRAKRPNWRSARRLQSSSPPLRTSSPRSASRGKPRRRPTPPNRRAKTVSTICAIFIGRGDARFEIRVNWLTGVVEVRDGSAKI